ncbi:uncharacterized protein LOC144332669 [Macaca mulatta]
MWRTRISPSEDKKSLSKANVPPNQKWKEASPPSQLCAFGLQGANGKEGCLHQKPKTGSNSLGWQQCLTFLFYFWLPRPAPHGPRQDLYRPLPICPLQAEGGGKVTINAAEKDTSDGVGREVEACAAFGARSEPCHPLPPLRESAIRDRELLLRFRAQRGLDPHRGVLGGWQGLEGSLQEGNGKKKEEKHTRRLCAHGPLSFASCLEINEPPNTNLPAPSVTYAPPRAKPHSASQPCHLTTLPMIMERTKQQQTAERQTERTPEKDTLKGKERGEMASQTEFAEPLCSLW